MRCAAEFIDVKKGMDLFPSGDPKNHRFLRDGADHIVGSANSASFLLATFGGNVDDKPKSVLSHGLKGFGRCHEFLRKRFVSSPFFAFTCSHHYVRCYLINISKGECIL